MNYAPMIRAIAGADEEPVTLLPRDARQLFAAMLEGGLPDLELGALLMALGTKALPQWALLALDAALADSVLPLVPPVCDSDQASPLVLPAYGGTRLQRNLTPLLALLLRSLHVPVLVHGTLEGHGRVASAYVFRELGIMPCMTLSQARRALDQYGIAFVPTGVIAPGLAQVMSLRTRTGISGLCHVMAALIDPFGGAGLRVVTAGSRRDLGVLRDVLMASGRSALLMAGSEGEPFADPRRRPRLEWLRDGMAMTLFEQEHAHEGREEAVPHDVGLRATASHICQVLDGSLAVPQPIANQLACCVYAAGHAADFNQAKAIVAVATRSLASSGAILGWNTFPGVDQAAWQR